MLTTTPTAQPQVVPLREAGLPWLTPEVWDNPPLGYGKTKLIWQIAEMQDDSMAPRFPKGCRVNITPLHARQNLVVDRVYLFDGRHPETGKPFCQMARLISVHESHLLVRADRAGTCSIWPLRAEERMAVWDVYEVTHYVSWPVPDTLPAYEPLTAAA